MPLQFRPWFVGLAVIASCVAQPAASSPADLTALSAELLAANTRHLDELLVKPEQVTHLKGKSAAGMTALAAYLTFEATGQEAYRSAAVKIADSVLAAMKATK